MNAATRRKLADLLPRLESDHDGEVVATARAVSRVLRSAGSDWHDVAAIVAGSTVPEEHPERDAWTDWRQMAEVCTAAGLARNGWERSFLAGLRDWTGDEITGKQAAVLARIFERGS